MRKNLENPFASEEPLSSRDQAVLDVFRSLMDIKSIPTLAAPPAVPVPSPAQLLPTVPLQPKEWGRFTPENINSPEACRRDNVRSLFDLSPSTSPLPEFAGKTPAIEKSRGYPRSDILSVNELRKYYGYGPESSKTCSRDVLHLRMERCVESRLRYPDDLSGIDMHELHVLRSDSYLSLRFGREFPVEHRELTIKLLRHERKFTQEEAEQYIAREESRVKAKEEANALAKAPREARRS
ncbi:MAG: hypothetical protein ABSG32_30180 [Terriglobia bacterium]